MIMTDTNMKRKHPPTYSEHAVKRILERGVPIQAVSNIVRYGVTVETHTQRQRVVKRGEYEGMPIHVVVHLPQTVISVYFAEEWISEISVRRSLKEKPLPSVVGQ